MGTSSEPPQLPAQPQPTVDQAAQAVLKNLERAAAALRRAQAAFGTS